MISLKNKGDNRKVAHFTNYMNCDFSKRTYLFLQKRWMREQDDQTHILARYADDCERTIKFIKAGLKKL